METLWFFAAAFGASALGGVLGMASGIFIVPILTLLFGRDIHVAIGASIVSVIACSCISAAPFIKGRLTNIRLAIVLETATTLGALTGVFLIGIVPTSVLYALFAAILALSAMQMLARRCETIDAISTDVTSWATVLRLHSSFPDQVTGKEMPYQVGHVPFGMVLMYAAGLISALLGIGSGVLKIP
uniref:sulfite exporter TauE/SafE family protein n=1 Tax=Brucella intermedia TaxID=94625 RepID=UPI00236099A0